MSELKVPPVLKDLYGDLRDRRLLPLLALVLVAIVAVPFLLGESPPESSEAPAVVVAGGGEAAEASALTVVEAQPGLRDYRRRLRARTPTDPFEQRYSGPMLKGAKLRSPVETGEPSGSTAPVEDPSSSGGSAAVESPPAPSGDGGGGGTPPSHGKGKHGGGEGSTDLLDFTIDVKLSHTEENEAGDTTMGKPVVREGVESLTSIPGEKAPVVTFLGVNGDKGRALFMVSKDVTAVFGEAKCVSGTETCELMELEPGFPETFEYGPGHVRYKLSVIEIDLAGGDKP